jgi:hypothetical protein
MQSSLLNPHRNDRATNLFAPGPIPLRFAAITREYLQGVLSSKAFLE